MTRKRSSKKRHRPAPEPIEAVFQPREIYPPLPSSITLRRLDNLNEMDRDPAKAKRILENAKRYLRGDSLYIHSARLRGPVTKNPWAADRVGGVKRKREVVAELERPEDPKKARLGKDGRMVVDTPDGPASEEVSLIRRTLQWSAASTTTPPSLKDRKTIEDSFTEEAVEQPSPVFSRRKAVPTVAITAEGSPRRTVSYKNLPDETEDKVFKQPKPPLELSNTQSPAFAFRRKGKSNLKSSRACDSTRAPLQKAEGKRVNSEWKENVVEEEHASQPKGDMMQVMVEEGHGEEEHDTCRTTNGDDESSAYGTGKDTAATSPEDGGRGELGRIPEQGKEPATIAPLVPMVDARDDIEHILQAQIAEAAAAEEAIASQEEKEKEGRAVKENAEVEEPLPTPALNDQVQVARTPATAKKSDASSPRTVGSGSGASDTSSNPEPDDSPWISTQYQLENTRKQFMAALMDTPSSRGRRTAEPPSEASRVPQSSLPMLTAQATPTPLTIAPRQLNLTFSSADSTSRQRTPSPIRPETSLKNAPSPFKTFTSPLRSSPARVNFEAFINSPSSDDKKEAAKPLMLFTPQQESLFSQHPLKTHDANWMDPADYSFLSDASPEKENGKMFGLNGKEKGIPDDGDQLTADVSSFFDADVWDIDKELQRAGGDNATPSQSKTGKKPSAARAAWTGSAKRRW